MVPEGNLAADVIYVTQTDLFFSIEPGGGLYQKKKPLGVTKGMCIALSNFVS